MKNFKIVEDVLTPQARKSLKDIKLPTWNISRFENSYDYNDNGLVIVFISSYKVHFVNFTGENERKLKAAGFTRRPIIKRKRL